MEIPSLAFEHINLTIDAKTVLQDVSFTVAQGEVLGIVGESGAGKSTLLKACMQLVKKDTGSVIWQNLTRQDIAYLPQQSELDTTLPITVYELVAMGLWYETGAFGGVSQAQKQRITTALEQVDMAGFGQRNIAALSSGQLQRVLFARMLVQNARFLLLDEPFNAVDAATTAALLEVLENTRKEGCAVIAVLHDKEQVLKAFPRTLLLAKEVIADGKTEEVLSTANLQRAIAQSHASSADRWCEVV